MNTYELSKEELGAVSGGIIFVPPIPPLPERLFISGALAGARIASRAVK